MDHRSLDGIDNLFRGKAIGIEHKIVRAGIVRIPSEMVVNEIPALAVALTHAATGFVRRCIPDLAQALDTHLGRGQDAHVQSGMAPEDEIGSTTHQDCLAPGSKKDKRLVQGLVIILHAERAALNHFQKTLHCIMDQTLGALIEFLDQALTDVTVLAIWSTISRS